MLMFARKIKMVYTRYADDITFSTNLKEIPPQLGCIKETELLLSNELKNIIENNGFKINGRKTRYAFKNNRQEVTGLTVNTFPNVNRKFARKIRAMLHPWEKYGVEDAATEYFEKYKKVGKPENHINTFIGVIVGKINFFRHIQYKENIGDSQLYRRFYSKVRELYPEAKIHLYSLLWFQNIGIFGYKSNRGVNPLILVTGNLLPFEVTSAINLSHSFSVITLETIA